MFHVNSCKFAIKVIPQMRLRIEKCYQIVKRSNYNYVLGESNSIDQKGCELQLKSNFEIL